jgi:peptidoglycan/LPS O-acetylase OafA/YrhL
MFGTLRTLLAINVVLLHIFSVPALGNYSVSFFFLLSGFLMTLIMNETYGFSLKGFTVFWKNRVLRLYPSYFVVLGITIIAIFVFPTIIKHPDLYLPTTVFEWISNITMVYPNVVPHRIEPRLVPPSWALTNEILFYFLISFGISKTLRRTLIWLGLSVLYYIVTYHFFKITSYRYSSILASSLPFAFGALLYWINKAKPLKKVSIFTILIVYGLFLINALLTSEYGVILGELSKYINIVLAFILVYLLYNYKVKRRYKKLDSYLGYYSYPVYLSHYLVVILYSSLIGYGTISNSFKLNIEALIPYFLVLLVVSFLIVHLVDIKIDRFKQKIKKRELNN